MVILAGRLLNDVKMKDSMTLNEFRGLLIYLRDNPQGVSIRINQRGRGWHPHFMSVIMTTKMGAIFADELIDEFVNVSSLSQITEFELSDHLSRKKSRWDFDLQRPVHVTDGPDFVIQPSTK